MSMKQVKVQDAQALLKDQQVFLLDVRSPGEHSEAHIKGCTLIPLDQLAGRLSQLPADKSRPVLVYCAMGGRSMRACGILTQNGFTAVHNLEGGITAWKDSGLPVE